MSKIIQQKNGYTILELLFYITFFSIFSFVVINAMITMSRSFRETSIQGELVQSGLIMERMCREIRAAYGINSINANDLVLNTKDDADVNKTVKFSLSGSNIQLIENNVVTGNLNTSNIIITDLTFTQITTIAGKAVKIVLSVRSSNDSLNRIVDFYDTIVLRGDY